MIEIVNPVYVSHTGRCCTHCSPKSAKKMLWRGLAVMEGDKIRILHGRTGRWAEQKVTAGSPDPAFGLTGRMPGSFGSNSK
jgi:hypothetical protein